MGVVTVYTKPRTDQMPAEGTGVTCWETSRLVSITLILFRYLVFSAGVKRGPSIWGKHLPANGGHLHCKRLNNREWRKIHKWGIWSTQSPMQQARENLFNQTSKRRKCECNLSPEYNAGINNVRSLTSVPSIWCLTPGRDYYFILFAICALRNTVNVTKSRIMWARHVVWMWEMWNI